MSAVPKLEERHGAERRDDSSSTLRSAQFRVTDDLPNIIPIDDPEISLAARMMRDILDELFPK